MSTGKAHLRTQRVQQHVHHTTVSSVQKETREKPNKPLTLFVHKDLLLLCSVTYS